MEVEKSNSLVAQENPQYAALVEVVDLRQASAKLDAIIGGFNLIHHRELRKKYLSHLGSYRMRSEYLGEKIEYPSQQLHPLSALVDIRANQIEESIEQLRIAKDLLLKNTYECVYAFTSLSIITNQRYDDYEDLQLMLGQQLSCICFDATMIMFHLTGFVFENNSAINLIRGVLLAYCVARSCLEVINKIQLLNNNYQEMNKSVDIYDTPLMQVTNEYSHEAIARALQLRLDKQLADSERDEDRLTAFKRAIAAITNMLSSYEITAEKDKFCHLNRMQYVSDFYLYAYSSCHTEEEAELFSEIKDKIFASKLPSYNAYARDAIYSIINESRRIQIADKNTGGLDVTKFNVDVIESCLKLFASRLKARDLAHAIFSKAKEEHKPDLRFVHMNSQVYLFYINAITGMIEHVTQSTPRLFDLASPLKNSGILKEKERYYSYLDEKSETMNPQKWSFRPVNMRPTSMVASSFLSGVNKPVAKIASTNKKSVANKSKTAKAKIAAKENKSSQSELQGTIFKEVAAHFKNNTGAIASHYLAIINHQSHRVQNNIPLKVSAMFGLAETLALVKDIKHREEILISLESQMKALRQRCRPSLPEDIFDGQYGRYQALLAPYLKAETDSFVEKPVLIKMAFKIGSNIPKVKYVVERNAAEKLVFRTGGGRLFQPAAIASSSKGSLTKELDYFADFRKRIPLEQMELSKNELTLIKFLYERRLFPLLKDGAVVDCIRRIPHRKINFLCFAFVAELEELLNNNSQALNVSKFELKDDSFHISFNNNGHHEEYFNITLIPAKGADMTKALRKFAFDQGAVTFAIYYCPITQSIIDPCRIYTRTKNGVLDAIGVLDSKFNIDQSFADKPDCMLLALAEDAKCRKYKVFLEASFIRQAIIRNRHLLHGERLKNKIPQALFDDLFIRGFDIFTILYEECGLMHNLFPMFNRSRQDYDIMRRACERAILRHQEYEHKFAASNQLGPAKCILTLPKTQEDELRRDFLSDLLKQKFMETHYLARYMIDGIDFNFRLFKDDFLAYMNCCSFSFDEKVMLDLRVLWKNEISNLHSRPSYHL